MIGFNKVYSAILQLLFGYLQHPMGYIYRDDLVLLGRTAM